MTVKVRLARTETAGDEGDAAYEARNTVENLKAAMAAYYKTESDKTSADPTTGNLVVKVQMGGNSNLKYKEASSLTAGDNCWTNSGVTKTFTIASGTAASINANPYVVISSTTFCYGLIGTGESQDALDGATITVTADVSVVHAA